MYRIVLEKDTLDVWVNGQKAEVAAEFVVRWIFMFGFTRQIRIKVKNNNDYHLCIPFQDDGTETHFTLGNQPAHILAISSGQRRKGILHKLIMNDNEIPEYFEWFDELFKYYNQSCDKNQNFKLEK